jgi:hypothetical protein
MTTKHPITPPPELVDKWVNQSPHINPEGYIATRAAQWGADQELEACCKQLDELQLGTCYPVTGDKLRAARRPKPPSLKEQALEWLVAAEELHKVSGIDPEGTIRRALEALPND